MSQTLYTLKALSQERQTRVIVLSTEGHACSLTWCCSLQQARHLAATKVFPTGREVDLKTWETEWYRRNQPTYYRIVAHENGGYYAHVWPFRGSPQDFGRAISDERLVGAFQDEEQLRQEIEQHYPGAQSVEGATR